MINNVRTDFLEPDMPFFALDAHLKRNQDAFRIVLRRVEKSMNNVKVVDASNLTYNTDNVHFDTNGHIQYGKRMFNAWLAMKETSSARYQDNYLMNRQKVFTVYTFGNYGKSIVFYNIPYHSMISLYSLSGGYINGFGPVMHSGEFSWDGRTASGNLAAPGIYLARIAYGQESEVIKVIL